MKQEKKAPETMIYRLVQNAIRREREGWPPDSIFGTYQPRRPDRPLADGAPASGQKSVHTKAKTE